MSDDAEFEAFAALVRRGRDVPEMVENLAERLEKAMPQHVDVKRGGLRRRLREVVIRFEPEQLRIELHGHRAVAWVDHVVRGVCVRSERIDLDDWLDALARSLSDEARRSTEMRLALEDALG